VITALELRVPLRLPEAVTEETAERVPVHEADTVSVQVGRAEEVLEPLGDAVLPVREPQLRDMDADEADEVPLAEGDGLRVLDWEGVTEGEPESDLVLDVVTVGEGV